MPRCCGYIVTMAIWALPTYLEAPVEPEVTTTALVSWQKKEIRLWLSWCLTHCANMHTHWRMEKRRSSQDLNDSESAQPLSLFLSASVWACWVTRGWNISEFHISTSPLSKSGFVQLFILHGTPISLVHQIMAVSWNTGWWINGTISDYKYTEKHKMDNSQKRLSHPVKWKFWNIWNLGNGGNLRVEIHH